MSARASRWQRWADFRRRQRARVTQHVDLPDIPEGAGPPEPDALQASTSVHPPAGIPLNRHSPFYIGLVGGLGVLAAYSLWTALGALDTVITLLVIAVFLTLALNPLVERLIRSGLGRPSAVAAVFALVVVVAVLLGLVVVPPVTQQGSELARTAPQLVDRLLEDPRLRDFESTYHVLDRLREELNRRLTDGAFMSQAVDGVLGVGKALASGIFSAVTVLVLTLYFLVSLPTLKRAAFALVPATRRPRVSSLAEAIMSRVGAYAIGQLLVATINAFCSYVMMKIVGIPYAAVLAVAVGALGLIPMVGATLGAVVVAVVAIFVDPTKALIAVVYFVIYQQLENYVVAPRMMQRTVSVPGAITIIAALAGGTLAGVLGALLAIPTAAGLLLLYEEVLVPRQQLH
ncbi:MAG: AI-2E family transporter [Candidatus Phosphoribacter sp.]